MNPSTPFWKDVLRWSALTAAFIGPGTVTTAAKAGATTGFSLLWVVLLATLSTILVQLVAARLSGESGMSLLDLLSELPGGKILVPLVQIALVFGCAAFQAGNLAGAGTGLVLAGIPGGIWLTVGLALSAFLILTFALQSHLRFIFGGFVALMAVFFISSATLLSPSLPELATGFLPNLPQQEGLFIALGLFGTTLVPYNLFLGSALARGASSQHILKAIAVSVGVGGCITAAILIAGTSVAGNFSFVNLADTMEHQLGFAGRLAFTVGLFAAGFSSALTAPFAAGLLFQDTGKRRFIVMFGVILIGALAALSGGAPAAVILTAQAFNAGLLPLVIGALFLLSRKNKYSLLVQIALGLLTVFFTLMCARWIFIQFTN